MIAQTNAYQLVAGGAKNVDPNQFNPIYRMFRQENAAEVEAGWRMAEQMARGNNNGT